MSGAHILGQPFTISDLAVPVNATVTCNCLMVTGAGTPLKVVNSAPVTCPHCQKVYVLSFEVAGKLGIAITDPKVLGVPL